ncbi:hypothetical protein [Paracidobacterium acidisoli]|uniref:VWA domain-containing protein n=1 Tax=Paracidobacterium acidisoli TaxID=2303751 RepID=A0A372IUF3_9BACT|nr:hypothetical protein [Paracidobacterium acidisoli]MBT9330010.1 hypothetical protein [Paracidobacterium acidisoli]
MKLSRSLAILAAAVMLLPLTFLGQSENQGQGRAIVTVLGKSAESTPAITQQDIKVQVDGKYATVTGWDRLQSPQTPLELVFLIDDSARTSLSRQFNEVANYLQALPPDAKAGIAYMLNGRADFAGPLTADHARLAHELHIPVGAPGENASPYFCLSDLAKRWPSQDRSARRIVVMITDGVDNYERRYDPQDPYVQAAITDSVRAGLVVYSIYWRDEGRFDRSTYANNSGQNLLSQLTQATGGIPYWQGFGNPVTFQPFFDDLNRRLQNQYELGFAAKSNGKPQTETLRLKISAPSIKVTAPEQVFVAPASAGQ